MILLYSILGNVIQYLSMKGVLDMKEEIDEILESGFDAEVEAEETRENMSWFIITPSWFIVAK